MRAIRPVFRSLAVLAMSLALPGLLAAQAPGGSRQGSGKPPSAERPAPERRDDARPGRPEADRGQGRGREAREDRGRPAPSRGTGEPELRRRKP